jgi:hypothetical protein
MDEQGDVYITEGITPAQAQAIATTVKLYTQVQSGQPQAQANFAQMDRNRAAGPPVAPPPAREADLQATKSSDLRVSDAGSGGAIIAPGFVAKVEPVVMAVAAVETQLVANEAFGADAANSPLQFIPTTIVQDAGSVGVVTNKLKEIKSSVEGDSYKSDAIDRHETSLKNGSSVIHMAPKVDGTTLNNLKTEEKIALLKSQTFANDLGKATVMCPVLGLSDHLGPNSVGANQTSTGYSNISNIMLDKNSGRLVAIDYAPRLDETTPNRIVGYGTPDKAVSSLAEFVIDASQSPDAFKAAVDKIMIDANADKGNSTPISETMRAVMHPAKMDALLTPNEAFVVKLMVSAADKRELVVQTLKGIVDGMEYVNKHAESLDRACQNSSVRHQLDAESGRNFIDQDQMANLKQGLGGIDFNQLRTNLNAVSQGQSVPVGNEVKQPSFEPAALDGVEQIERQMAGPAQQVAEQAQGVVVPTPAVTPVPVASTPLVPTVGTLDDSQAKPSRLPPPVPVDEGPDLSAAGGVRIPPAPDFPPPPPPDDQDAADLAQGAGLPVLASASPGRVTLTPDEIDQMISRDSSKSPAWSPEKAQTRNAPNYTDFDSYSNTSSERQGQEFSKQDRRAVEMRMIETMEIQPRQEHIAKLEQQLDDLHQSYGSGSTRPEITALNEELNQLYEEVDVYETRVAALKETLKNDLPKDRLAAINQEQQAINASVEPKVKQPSIQFGEDVKTNDGNPRQEHELTVSAGTTAQGFVGKVPAGGITPDDLAGQIKEAYKKAYQYDGPARFTINDDNSKTPVNVKAANDRRITPAEIDRVAAGMQPVVDQVNELQAQIETLKASEDGPGVADQIQDLKALQTKLLTDYSDVKMAQAAAIKPAPVQEMAGLQATTPDLLAQPGKSAMKQTATVETNQKTLQNSQQRQDRIDRLTTPEPTLLSSVRDTLSPAALQVKAAELNAEGRLRDVDTDIQDQYKDLKTQLKDPTLSQDDQVQVEAEMAKLKQAHPALEQLDRSTVGRNLHSGLRDAVQTASAVKDRLTHPTDTLKDVRSQLREGAKSLKQGLTDSLPDRFKVMNINRDIDKLGDKITDLKSQLDQMKKEQMDYKTVQLGTLRNANLNGRIGDEARDEVKARLEKQHGDVSGKSKEELFEMDMEITNQGLAEFDDKIAALEDSITKAEAKVEVLKGQKDAIKNKKDVSLGQGQVVQQKL